MDAGNEQIYREHRKTISHMQTQPQTSRNTQTLFFSPEILKGRMYVRLDWGDEYDTSFD